MKKFVLFISILLSLSVLISKGQQIFEIDADLMLVQLKENVYQHISYKNLENYGRAGANGLVVLTDSGAVIIDTPWDNELSELLIQSINKKFNSKVCAVVATHSHIDCAGGLDAFNKRGILSYGLDITKQKLMAEKNAFPLVTFTDSLIFSIGNKSFELFYPGAGHTIDNIVVYDIQDKVLFGGCLLKALEANSKGNIADADIDEWPKSVRNVSEKYGDAEIVLPGHGSAGSAKIFSHTLDIVSKQ